MWMLSRMQNVLLSNGFRRFRRISNDHNILNRRSSLRLFTTSNACAAHKVREHLNMQDFPVELIRYVLNGPERGRGVD